MSFIKFNSNFIKTDISIVKLTKNYIFAGTGSFLQIYDIFSKVLVKKIQIFNGYSICNILINSTDNRILLTAEYNLKIFQTNIPHNVFEELKSKQLKDWILTGEWLDNDDIALILMHNILIIINQNLEIKQQINCDESCILYSANICNNSYNDLVVLSGTVFREILIWWPFKSNGKVLTRLKGHKGVIFSISYNKYSGYICSSSDDRTTILWSIKHKNINLELNDNNSTNIQLKLIVKGHQSRIFRCVMLKNFFLTAGEDSIINLWDFNGNCIKKFYTYKGSSIWGLDCDEKRKIIASGSSNCGLTIFPIISPFLNQSRIRVREKISLPDQESPKQIVILNSGNLAIVSENGILFYYNIEDKVITNIEKYQDLSKYVLLQVSKCRNLISLSGYDGQIYIYKEINNSLILLCTHQFESKSRIFSFHWLTCQLFLTCENEGKLNYCSLKNNKIEIIYQFRLPACKERWSTAACLIGNDLILIGDRKGNLHLFTHQQTDPLQSLKKVHNYLGITNLINNNNNSIISLGRNGCVKTFNLTNNQKLIELISCDKTPFSWLVNFENDHLTAFSSNNFIVWNYKNKRILFEYNCGGGHRSWDFNHSQFVFVKDKLINLINCNLRHIQSIDIISDYHSKTINSVVCLKLLNENFLIISGSDDTTLRLSIFKNNFENISNLKSHLSSIRVICDYQIDSNNYLIFSGGGRAQIICWKLTISENNILCTEQYSYYESMIDSEMRIMDSTIDKIDNEICLFAACSDGNIKLFHIQTDDKNYNKYKLIFIRNIFYKLICLMKIQYFRIFESDILLTMATDGKLVFWSNMNDFNEPIYLFNCHQSGINSYSFKLLSSEELILLTGGDDNAIQLNLFKFILNDDQLCIKQITNQSDVGTHCTQITGVFICDNYFLTCGTDQKLAVFSWIRNNDILSFKLISKYMSSIPDIQGMKCFLNNLKFNVFLYGKGIEGLDIS